MRRTLKQVVFSCAAALLLAFVPGDDFTVQLQDDLNGFYMANMPLKLFVFHDQPAYTPGDTVFYKATLVRASDHKLVQNRVVAAVKLATNQGMIVARQLTLLKDGHGEGYLVIPDSVSTGRYTFEACNKWIQNQTPELCYRESIQLGGVTSDMPVASTGFFPEGGSLIQGIPNRVVVRGTPNSAGTITLENGNPVASFNCNGSGLGNFYISPSPVPYFVTSTDGGRKPLPLDVRTGINVMVTGLDKGEYVRVVIQHSPGFETVEPLYVVVWKQNTLTWKARVSLNNKGGAALQIPKTNVLPGVNGLTVFSGAGTVLAERLFYLPESSNGIDVELDKNQYSTREQARAWITLDSSMHQAEVAVSVYQLDLFHRDATSNNAKTFFEITSDTGSGCLPSLETPSDTDMFLITQHWKRFSWTDVRERKSFDSQAPEARLVFDGKAFFRNSGEPVPDSTLLVFLLQRNIVTYETYVKGGGFSCPLLIDFFGNEDVFFQAYYKENKLEGISVQLSGDEPLPIVDCVHSSLLNPYSQFATDRNEISKIFTPIDRARKDGRVYNWADEITEFVDGADVVIDLKDYLLFPTIKETIHEIVPALKVRTNKKGDYVRMVIEDLHAESKADPLYIIDGAFCDNTDFFLGIKPENIRSIKLINTSSKLAKIGLVQNGIVIIDTDQPSLRTKIPRSESVFKTSGFNEKRRYPVAKDDPGNPRIPDIRSNVYWNPRIKLSGRNPLDFTFILPDNTGTYVIVVDGITTTGRPLHMERTFSVGIPR